MRKRSCKPGKTVKCTASYQKLDEILAGYYGKGGFSFRELKEKSSLESPIVGMFLLLRMRSGVLKRIGRGLYQEVKGVKKWKRMRRRLPQAFVAEKVFEVLRETDKPMNLETIVIKTEHKAGDPNLSLYFSVGVILFRWSRSGALQRSGKRMFYRYQLKRGINKRPTIINLG